MIRGSMKLEPTSREVGLGRLSALTDLDSLIGSSSRSEEMNLKVQFLLI